jgi:hypothetical protein
MNVITERVVLLFFENFVSDSFFPKDRYIKQFLRPFYHKIKKGQKISGFEVSLQLLIKALQKADYKVYLNNYKLAACYPDYPVGLVGYPHLLEHWSLPNPVLLGPSLYDHPSINPTLLDDPRYKQYLVLCDWMYEMFEPVYGKKYLKKWYAGIDTEVWQDTRFATKSIDVLIYDKIRWNRDRYEPELLKPITRFLDQKGFNYKIIRYKRYDHQLYRELLSASRTMIFLCEHETQGLAYQEALSSNLPILAWNPGWWVDPNRKKYSAEPIPACSVPYFSSECGEKFEDFSEFAAIFETFWSRLPSYEPRQFVERELSFSNSAKIYWDCYQQVAMANSIH